MAHIEGNEVIRASVWIRPGGEAGRKLQDAINHVQRKLGGPGGLPHIGVLAGIETTRADAEAKLKRLAGALRAFRLTLGEVDFRNDYYSCLFLRVQDNGELAAAHQRAHAIFEMNPPDPYEPHVALLYGEEPVDAKRALAQELGDDLAGTQVDVDELHLVNAAPGVPVSQWRTLVRALLPRRGSKAQRSRVGDVPYSSVGGG